MGCRKRLRNHDLTSILNGARAGTLICPQGSLTERQIPMRFIVITTPTYAVGNWQVWDTSKDQAWGSSYYLRSQAQNAADYANDNVVDDEQALEDAILDGELDSDDAEEVAYRLTRYA